MFSLCKPVSSRKRFLPHRLLSNGYTFTLFDRAQAIPRQEWAEVAGQGAVFLDPVYLAIIEDSVHTTLQCRYVLVYKSGKPCGIIYFQVVDFNAGLFGNMISRQVESIRSRKMNLFERYLHSNREEVLLRLFTCGNNLVSGEHGFCFDNRIPKEKSHELLLLVTDVISREEKLRGTISAILLKDFYRPLKPEKLFEEESYSRFSVEPNLVVEIPAGINSLAEYIGLFSKKYRNRARTIFRSMEAISVRELDAADILRHEERIYALYTAVFEKAKFRLMQLPLRYFSSVKERFGKRFIVKGYFENDRLTAFTSCFVMPGGTLEAHYIGLDYDANREHDLYQNILYAMVGEGIAQGCHQVNLGRTAAEIKTTVGARPRDLYCYIKSQNTISRLIQRPFITFLQPAPWTPRNPFREEPVQPAK